MVVSYSHKVQQCSLTCFYLFESSIEEFLACVGAWGEENSEKAAAMRVQVGQYLQTADQVCLFLFQPTSTHFTYEGITIRKNRTKYLPNSTLSRA
jgi:hypothetical protein